MSDESNSGEDRTNKFDVVLRGYDRTQVESFLTEAAERIEGLESELAGVSQAALAIGVDDPEALARELNAIGGEVGGILEAARSAAEGLRTRAATDAKNWTTSAESDASTMMSDATEQAHSMRASAWNEGSSMLQSAFAAVQETIDESKEEALFIRAEAEREALRHTGDAKRDKEETIRSARLEAEQVLEKARAESDGMLNAANQAAELAQERARALEERRGELLNELEAAKSSIGQLETEIESKRQALETPPEPVVVEPDRTHHSSDGGSVRIVSPSKSVTLKPVDADSFVAEVVALRSGTVEQPEDRPVVEPPVELHKPVPRIPAAQTPPISAPEPEAIADVEPEPKTASAPPVVAAEKVDPAPQLKPPVGQDAIGSLFAQLKEDTGGAASSQPSVHSEQTIDVTEAAPVEAVDTPSSAVGVESLVPMQNAALRDIKRSLVDLQNDTLEHLRTDDDWLPPKKYANKFGEAFASMADAIGTHDKDGREAAAFQDDLLGALVSAIEKSRDSGAGSRAVAAAASKVFRTWRSDEAERRVVASAESFASASVEV